MPEGDTVWRAGRRLHEALSGQQIDRSDFRVPALATTTLVGSRVLEVVSRGKHLLFRLDDGRTLHTHFRMDGSWHLYRPVETWRGGPSHAVRVVLATTDWVAVGYRLPVIDLVATSDEASLVGHLGPDLLGADWDPVVAASNLASHPDRAIGAALLDQRTLAGLGTIYVSETLHVAGVAPPRATGDAVDLADVVDIAHRLLRRGIDRASPCTTGDERRPLYVYGRHGRPCHRCGSTIRRVEVGVAPQARQLAWCPGCQD